MHENTMRLIAFFMTMWFAMSGSQAWADDAQVQPAERTVIEDVGIDTLMPNESAREKNAHFRRLGAGKYRSDWGQSRAIYSSSICR